MLDTLTRPGFTGQVSTLAAEIPISINDRSLAYAKLTPSQRAGIAAAVQLGELRSGRPTAEQVTQAYRANRVYVRKARRATPAQRSQLICGAVTIQELERPTSTPRRNGGSWGSLTDSALEAAVRDAGVARVWDAIARIID